MLTWHENCFKLHNFDPFIISQVGADPTHHTENAQVSADMPFMEMTSQCEALTTGKQQKMSTFMSFQPSMQPAPMPNNHHPNQMELDLFHDPQLPQVAYIISTLSLFLGALRKEMLHLVKMLTSISRGLSRPGCRARTRSSTTTGMLTLSTWTWAAARSRPMTTSNSIS